MFVLFTSLAAVLIALFVLRALGLSILAFILRTTPGALETFEGSWAWTRSQTFRTRLAQRFPTLTRFIARRIDPRRPTGLLLTLTGMASVYLAALFSGLTEEILEAQGTIWLDDLINAQLGILRTEPVITAFAWITNFGSSPSIIVAVIIATGFLWSQRRLFVILPLWITTAGALVTTTIGKLLVARHRPEFILDIPAAGWSFPSGHATAAMAVYGFIAYAIARALPGMRERFDVAYWTAVLIILVGFSRMLLSVHYLTDVIGGFIVGGFWLLIGVGIAEWKRPALSQGSVDPAGRVPNDRYP